SISVSGDVDFYKLAGVPANSRVWAYVDTAGGTPSAGSVLTPYAAGGKTVMGNADDDGRGTAGPGAGLSQGASIIMRAEPTTGGPYYLAVKEYSTSTISGYRLHVTITPDTTPDFDHEPDDTPWTADVLLAPGDRRHLISIVAGGGDVDYLSVYAEAGNILLIG